VAWRGRGWKCSKRFGGIGELRALNGKTNTASINMEDIVYTVANPSDNLTLQITSSATAYENFTSFGFINISNINLYLPTPAVVTTE